MSADDAGQGCGKVLYDDGDHLGLCKVVLYDNGATLALRTWRRIQVTGPAGPWLKSVRGQALILSFRGGRLSVYESFTRRRRRYLRNATPDSQALRVTVASVVSGLGDRGDRLAAEILDSVADAVLVLAGRHQIALPDDPYRAGRDSCMLVAAYPLLAGPVNAGVALPDRLPTALTPYLRCMSYQEAARRAFGRKGDAKVADALEQSLGRDAFLSRWSDLAGRVNLYSFAAARMGRSVLTSAEIAGLLTANGPQIDAYDLPDDGQIRAMRRMFLALHPSDGARLLHETVTSPGGPKRLVRLLRRWDRDGRVDLADRPHLTVTEVHDHLAEVYDEKTVGDHPVAFPAQLSNLDGHVLAAPAGAATLRVPTSTLEIGRWGRQLRNRVGETAGDCAEGTMWLVGVERDGSLVGALQVDASTGHCVIASSDVSEGSQTACHLAQRALNDLGLLSGLVRAVPGTVLSARACQGPEYYADEVF